MLMLSLFLITTANNSIYAEGTKELSPNDSDRVYLYLNGDRYNNFGRYDGNADQRLFFHIANPNQEQVFLGFSQSVSSGHYPCEGNPNISFFRIKDPNGNIVYPTPNNSNGQILDGTTANLDSLQLEAGPRPIGGPSGYDPFIFDPAGLPAGDYYIEFSSIVNIPSPGLINAIRFWDITVATKDPTPVAKKGRVFATNWSFHAPSIECEEIATYGWFDRPFNGRFYVLSKEGFVNLVDFKDAGFQPAAFNLFFNETGTANTNNPISDRKSVQGLGNALALQKIFLNDPDPIVYPSGEYGALLKNPDLHMCESSGDACILVEATKEGQIEILIDLDKQSGDFVYDPNTADVIIVFNISSTEGETAPYSRCIPWDQKDGFGNKVPSNATFDLLVTYQQGVYHLPIYDVEYLLNGITTMNVRPTPPSGIITNKLYYDDSNIPHLPGNNTSNIELNGCDAPCHTWTNKDYGNLNTINSWFFADEESKIKDETPKCLIDAVNDQFVTNFETPISLEILGNDTGNIIDTASLFIATPSPHNGVITIKENGLIDYQPPLGFNGLDSFEYAICYDFLPKNALCDYATVYINVGNSHETDCKDGIDNDQDGLIDCEDPDCLPNSPLNIIRKKGE